METIYWIQRLDAINVAVWIVFTISVVVGIIASISYHAEKSFADTLDKCERNCKTAKHCIKVVSWVAGISLLVGIFVPTKKEMYAIYGIGGTIDYLKSNDTARHLPDKVVNALDAWLDSQINDDNDKSDNQ